MTTQQLPKESRFLGGRRDRSRIICGSANDMQGIPYILSNWYLKDFAE